MKQLFLSFTPVVWPISIAVMLVAALILYNKSKSGALIGLALGFGLILVSVLSNILFSPQATLDVAGKIITATTPPEWITIAALGASNIGAILCGASLLAFSLHFHKDERQTKIDEPNRKGLARRRSATSNPVLNKPQRKRDMDLAG
jgi:hypothetical protein